MARSGRRRYTAASSLVSSPTSRSGSSGPPRSRTMPSTVPSSAGDSLQAQPAPCDRLVSRTVPDATGPLTPPRPPARRRTGPVTRSASASPAACGARHVPAREGLGIRRHVERLGPAGGLRDAVRDLLPALRVPALRLHDERGVGPQVDE